MPANPEQLWAEKYAQKFAEERAREESRREQAFLDLPAELIGEQVRVMTPVDLLVLNGIESPFVCGAPDAAEPGEVAAFIWWLHVDNARDGSWWNERRKSKMLRRIAEKPYAYALKQIKDYVDEIFQDAPQGSRGEGRPLGACFLAPLVVSIAQETGWSQNEILNTPLPRLFQYMKAMRAKAAGKEFKDFSPSDRLTSEFLSELNESMNAGARN